MQHCHYEKVSNLIIQTNQEHESDREQRNAQHEYNWNRIKHMLSKVKHTARVTIPIESCPTTFHFKVIAAFLHHLLICRCKKSTRRSHLAKTSFWLIGEAEQTTYDSLLDFWKSDGIPHARKSDKHCGSISC